MKRTVVVGILMGAFLLGSAAPAHALLIYQKPAFKGRVIDAGTKEPIEGAVVVTVYWKKTAGPAESYESIINVRETLTNKDGEFSIPSYTTVIQPLSWTSRVDFIIFKPGYGRFPDGQVYPPRDWLMRASFSDPYLGFWEEFFGGETGVAKEISVTEMKVGAEWRKEKVVFGLVELPRLRTREERLRATPSAPGDYRSQELPLLFKAINEERRRFNLKDVR